MNLTISNINPPDKENNFITTNVRLSDIFDKGDPGLSLESISFFVHIHADKDDASLSQIRDLSIQQTKVLLTEALRKIDDL